MIQQQTTGEGREKRRERGRQERKERKEGGREGGKEGEGGEGGGDEEVERERRQKISAGKVLHVGATAQVGPSYTNYHLTICSITRRNVFEGVATRSSYDAVNRILHYNFTQQQ